MEKILTILVAALPVGELRAAIPLAIFRWGISPFEAYILAVIGNFLPVIPLLWFLEHATHRVAAWHPFFHKTFHWVFERTRRKHGKKFETSKALALFIFVAIPLPLTGAWTGAVASYLFGIPFWKAVLAIGCGVLVSGLLVLASAGLFL
ncbi:MAG: small multi-drug export protein [Nanoarchaeota archaeon]|nr:small multi-drug export protein [Nanoarchaeota archaeon]